MSGVLLITPFLPIIFNKFNRFQQEAETSQGANKQRQGANKQRTRDYPRGRAFSTQYEANESLIKEKTRRFTIG